MTLLPPLKRTPPSSTSFPNGVGSVAVQSISENTIQRLTTIFKLLADRSRLKIVLALAQAGEMHVTALCEMLGGESQKASQPAVSHHLTLMKAVGLVTVDRRGKHNFYSLASDHVRDLIEQIFADDAGATKELRIQEWVLSFQRKPE